MTTITIDPEPYPAKTNGDGPSKKNNWTNNKQSGGFSRMFGGGGGILMKDMDDFLHSSSVAAAHVGIRMGTGTFCSFEPRQFFYGIFLPRRRRGYQLAASTESATYAPCYT